MIDSPIIVALDFDNRSHALSMIDKLDPSMCRLKVGKEMFTLFGPQLVKDIHARGFDLFLDLKFHDIPNTVAKAIAATAELGVWMTNVHASGGLTMMQAAREALLPYGDNAPILIGVTVLTSMSQQDLSTLGINNQLDQQVLYLSELAAKAGLDGVVCSAQEAHMLKQALGMQFKLVTPGIRPLTSEHGDQSRVMTPQAAIQAGSDYLVIGRPITQSADPLKTLSDIRHSIVY